VLFPRSRKRQTCAQGGFRYYTSILKRIGTIIAVAVALAAAAPACRAADEITKQDGLPNFHRVNEHLYRGGQPRRIGFRKLAGLGIRTVVDLRGSGERSDKEQALAKSFGMRYINLPLPRFAAPDAQKMQELLRLLDAPENWPVFVHCRRGSDRTGVVIACYRIFHDGWTNERAKREAESYGLAAVEIRMKRFIMDFRPGSAAKQLAAGAGTEQASRAAGIPARSASPQSVP
jgi:tyrosine-protein phosphatase SIW14